MEEEERELISLSSVCLLGGGKRSPRNEIVKKQQIQKKKERKQKDFVILRDGRNLREGVSFLRHRLLAGASA